MKRKVAGPVMAKRLTIKVRISLMIGVAQARFNTGQISREKCSMSALQKGNLKIATA